MPSKRALFKDPKFVLLFFGTGIATFPLLVPPFFIPLYALSLGISATTASVLLATFNLSSAVGRVSCGFLCDAIGPVTALFISMVLSALSMLAIWPVSTSLAPLVVFIIINGMGNGAFFSTVPSVVGHIYGPTRVPTTLAMVVTAWAAGYIMVRILADIFAKKEANRTRGTGGACGRIPFATIRRHRRWTRCLSPRYVLRRLAVSWQHLLRDGDSSIDNTKILHLRVRYFI